MKQEATEVKVILNFLKSLLPEKYPTYPITEFEHGVNAGKQMMYDELVYFLEQKTLEDR